MEVPLNGPYLLHSAQYPKKNAIPSYWMIIPCIGYVVNHNGLATYRATIGHGGANANHQFHHVSVGLSQILRASQNQKKKQSPHWPRGVWDGKMTKLRTSHNYLLLLSWSFYRSMVLFTVQGVAGLEFFGVYLQVIYWTLLQRKTVLTEYLQVSQCLVVKLRGLRHPWKALMKRDSMLRRLKRLFINPSLTTKSHLI